MKITDAPVLMCSAPIPRERKHRIGPGRAVKAEAAVIEVRAEGRRRGPGGRAVRVRA